MKCMSKFRYVYPDILVFGRAIKYLNIIEQDKVNGIIGENGIIDWPILLFSILVRQLFPLIHCTDYNMTLALFQK